MKTKLFALTLVAATLFLWTRTVNADFVNPFASLGNYNAVITGNFHQTGSGDTEGYLAVGGNMVTDGWYCVGSDVRNAAPGSVALIVAGDLRTQYAWEVAGNAYYATGSSKNPAWNGEPVNYKNNGGNQGKRVDTHPLDFSVIKSEMGAYSSQIAQLQATASLKQEWGNSIINVGGGQQVVNISIDDLANGALNNVKINGQSDTVLVINIFGGENTSLSMSNGFEVYGVDVSNIMFNLVDVDTLTIQNMELLGSVLGLETDVSIGNGAINGYSVFENAVTTNGGEFHNDHLFDGGIDLPPSAVTPEPASALIVGLGLVSLPFFRRRFAKKAA